MPRKQVSAHCPECDATVTFKRRPRLGQIIVCRRCDTRLEVIDLDPVELDWAFDEAEDEFAFESYGSNDSYSDNADDDYDDDDW